MDSGNDFETSNVDAEGVGALPPTARTDGAAPATMPAAGENFHVVGIGASAGGLEALETFFDNVPDDSGMAYVVIQHLSPDFKSLMDELLGRHTRLAIHRVENGMPVAPNAIYLIPPKKQMIISGRRLLLTDKDPDVALPLPIDTFFRSLAQDLGPRAIGVILSGTGSDGSRGIREIHQAGGLVLVQSLETARFDGMPKSAVDTGVVDVVLPTDEIPPALLTYVRRPTTREELARSSRLPVTEDGMQGIFRLLREHYGIDFAYYKPSTVTRRVERRLQMSRAAGLDEYVEQLRGDGDELNQLYRDLLIGVTEFFRDPEAFERLERDILPQILSRIPSDQEIRIWSAGCATGEEAYSLAILVHEYLTKAGRPLNVRIFATDVHPSSLEFASLGLYNDSSVGTVAPARRARYFVPHGRSHQVVPELRKMIVFAPHNLIKDAPFTKLDLVICRNMLIYLQPPAQKKALSLFHFSLKAGGILFLGPSESPGDLAEEFESIDSHWRMYRKRRDVRLPPDLRLPLSVGYPALGRPQSTPAVGAADVPLLRVYDALLDEYIPSSLLVNDRGELVHTFGGAGEFLEHRDGRTSNQVLERVVEDLKIALAGALQRVAKEGAPVAYNGVRVRTTEGERQLRISVRPILGRGLTVPHMLVRLEPMHASPSEPPRASPAIDLEQASRDHVHSLESELAYTRENLQSTVEELETSNEELQATNEELLASNEELQSTNEELHSVNEELYTVNAEYQRKIVELTELTDDVENLLRSTDVAVMFLDPDLRIRKFTPQIARAFEILPQDVGRRVDSFSHHIEHAGLLDDIRRVLDSGLRCERSVRDRQGNWHLLRILPYRRKSSIQGVVVTLIDVNSLVAAQNDLRLMSSAFQQGADPQWICDGQGRVVDANAEALRVFELPRDRMIESDMANLVDPAQQSRVAELLSECQETQAVRNVEMEWRTGSDRLIPMLVTMSRLSSDGQTGERIAVIAKEITALKNAEAATRLAVKRRDQFLAMLSHELRNPLAAVLNSTHVIQTPGVDGDIIGKACQVIRRQAQQMARLLDDLLDVARVTQGKITMRKTPLDLTRLAPDVVQAVRPLIDARSHQLRQSIWGEPLYVLGDSSRLLQVQENLLHNAAKYTPAGGTLWFTIERDGDDALIRFRDTGVGMTPHLIEPMFDLFVQSDHTLDRADGGMGVGLTLVRSLTAMHDGTVTATSPGPGQGSEFVVRLPLCPVPEPAAQEPPAAADRPPESVVAPRVVLIEDNADSREMLRALLRLGGADVVVAEDGPRGLEAIRNHRPDVAVVDIGLPEMDGYQVARQVRRDLPANAIYLVALTGYGSRDDRRAALDAGFDEHLVKPPRHEDLLRIIHTRPARPA